MRVTLHLIALARIVACVPLSVVVAIEVNVAGRVAEALIAVLGCHVRGVLRFAVLQAELGSTTEAAAANRDGEGESYESFPNKRSISNKKGGEKQNGTIHPFDENHSPTRA